MFKNRNKKTNNTVDYKSQLSNASYTDLFNMKVFELFPFLKGFYGFPTCFKKMFFYLNMGNRNIGYYDFLDLNGSDGRIVARDLDRRGNINHYHNFSLSKIENCRIYSESSDYGKDYNGFDVYSFDLASRDSKYGNFVITSERIFNKDYYDYVFFAHYFSQIDSDRYCYNDDFENTFSENLYFYFPGNMYDESRIDFKDFLIYLLSNGNFDYFQNDDGIKFLASYSKYREFDFFNVLRKSFQNIDSYRITRNLFNHFETLSLRHDFPYEPYQYRD